MSLCYNFDHAEEEQGIKTTKAITQKDGGMVENSLLKNGSVKK